MAFAIELNNLRKTYGAAVAVENVSFNVSTGEVFGLLGPNGAGKTTTVECLLGLRTPDSGQVRLLGMEHAHQSKTIHRLIGVQLQTTGLQPLLTVREQIQLFASFFPRPLPVESVIAQVGLSEKVRTTTKSLSGGQKQRLAVAIALISDPELIFLDEPTTGLDPQSRRSLWEVIRNLKAAGKSVLLTTHYMEEAEQLCDRVAILDHGRIIEMAPPQALIQRHFQETAIEFVAQAANFSARLAELPGVITVSTNEAQNHSSPAGTTAYTLYTTDVPRSMAGLLGLSDSRTIRLTNITVRQATLEDVFLKLTGRRIRE